jgi:hypothetical protein
MLKYKQTNSPFLIGGKMFGWQQNNTLKNNKNKIISSMQI